MYSVHVCACMFVCVCVCVVSGVLSMITTTSVSDLLSRLLSFLVGGQSERAGMIGRPPGRAVDRTVCVVVFVIAAEATLLLLLINATPVI